MKSILFGALIIGSAAHAVTDEYLNARSERYMESIAQNPIRMAKAKVSIRRVNGVKADEILATREVEVPVIDEAKPASEPRYTVVAFTTFDKDGAPVMVQLDVQARLQTIKDENARIERRVKTVRAELSLHRTGDGQVIRSGVNQVRMGLYATAIVLPVTTEGITLDALDNGEVYAATVEFSDPAAL